MADRKEKQEKQKKAMVKLGFYEMIDLLSQYFRTIEDCQDCRKRMTSNSDGSIDLGQPDNCLDQAMKLKGLQETLVKDARKEANKHMIVLEPVKE